MNKRITYINVDFEEQRMNHGLLDFLSEKVVLIASCNGLLCCRSCISLEDSSEPVRPRKIYHDGIMIWSAALNSCTKELIIYVCNPTTKKWIALRPSGCDVRDCFGLAFHPSGTPANNSLHFKLVSIQLSKVASHSHSFLVCSSERGKWTTTKDVLRRPYRIHKNRQTFVGHKFHLLTLNHHVITFDVETELPRIIELPGPVIEDEGRRGICLGSSEGYFHCVCVNSSEIRVWMLKDYCKRAIA